MLPSQRALFNIQRDVCYLNAASGSPANPSRGRQRAVQPLANDRQEESAAQVIE